MQRNTPLDCAEFLLTRSRSRCELHICANGVKEKLASGYIKPFVIHLQAAEAQFAKGNQVIRLERPSNLIKKNKVTWFTKGTLERFVRFVSTPEVLEHVKSIEDELSQLENVRVTLSKTFSQSEVSMDTIRSSSGVFQAKGGKSMMRQKSSLGADDNGSDASKIELLRAMDARLVALKQEQSVAFSRAEAAGFDSSNMADLLDFSEHFGADRLRDACIQFVTLFRKRAAVREILEESESPLADAASSGSDMSLESGTDFELAAEPEVDFPSNVMEARPKVLKSGVSNSAEKQMGSDLKSGLKEEKNISTSHASARTRSRWGPPERIQINYMEPEVSSMQDSEVLRKVGEAKHQVENYTHQDDSRHSENEMKTFRAGEGLHSTMHHEKQFSLPKKLLPIEVSGSTSSSPRARKQQGDEQGDCINKEGMFFTRLQKMAQQVEARRSGEDLGVHFTSVEMSDESPSSSRVSAFGSSSSRFESALKSSESTPSVMVVDKVFPQPQMQETKLVPLGTSPMLQDRSLQSANSSSLSTSVAEHPGIEDEDQKRKDSLAKAGEKNETPSDNNKIKDDQEKPVSTSARRLSVQAAISLFESKKADVGEPPTRKLGRQDSQKGVVQRQDSQKGAVQRQDGLKGAAQSENSTSEKSLLRRWSAVGSDSPMDMQGKAPDMVQKESTKVVETESATWKDETMSRSSSLKIDKVPQFATDQSSTQARQLFRHTFPHLISAQQSPPDASDVSSKHMPSAQQQSSVRDSATLSGEALQKQFKQELEQSLSRKSRNSVRMDDVPPLTSVTGSSPLSDEALQKQFKQELEQSLSRKSRNSFWMDDVLPSASVAGSSKTSDVISVGRCPMDSKPESRGEERVSASNMVLEVRGHLGNEDNRRRPMDSKTESRDEERVSVSNMVLEGSGHPGNEESRRRPMDSKTQSRDEERVSASNLMLEGRGHLGNEENQRRPMDLKTQSRDEGRVSVSRMVLEGRGHLRNEENQRRPMDLKTQSRDEERVSVSRMVLEGRGHLRNEENRRRPMDLKTDSRDEERVSVSNMVLEGRGHLGNEENRRRPMDSKTDRRDEEMVSANNLVLEGRGHLGNEENRRRPMDSKTDSRDEERVSVSNMVLEVRGHLGKEGNQNNGEQNVKLVSESLVENERAPRRQPDVKEDKIDGSGPARHPRGAARDRSSPPPSPALGPACSSMEILQMSNLKHEMDKNGQNRPLFRNSLEPEKEPSLALHDTPVDLYMQALVMMIDNQHQSSLSLDDEESQKQQRGRFYEHYLRLRNARQREEPPAKRAEKEAKLKSMKETLERRKAEMEAGALRQRKKGSNFVKEQKHRVQKSGPLITQREEEELGEGEDVGKQDQLFYGSKHDAPKTKAQAPKKASPKLQKSASASRSMTSSRSSPRTMAKKSTGIRTIANHRKLTASTDSGLMDNRPSPADSRRDSGHTAAALKAYEKIDGQSQYVRDAAGVVESRNVAVEVDFNGQPSLAREPGTFARKGDTSYAQALDHIVLESFKGQQDVGPDTLSSFLAQNVKHFPHQGHGMPPGPATNITKLKDNRHSLQKYDEDAFSGSNGYGEATFSSSVGREESGDAGLRKWLEADDTDGTITHAVSKPSNSLDICRSNGDGSHLANERPPDSLDVEATSYAFEDATNDERILYYNEADQEKHESNVSKDQFPAKFSEGDDSFEKAAEKMTDLSQSDSNSSPSVMQECTTSTYSDAVVSPDNSFEGHFGNLLGAYSPKAALPTGSPLGSPLSWKSSKTRHPSENSSPQKLVSTYSSPQKLLSTMSQQPSKEPARGFKRLLHFGRKSRPSEAVSMDGVSVSTTSEGDIETEEVMRQSSDELFGVVKGSCLGSNKDPYGFQEQGGATHLRRSSIPFPSSNFKPREDHLSGGASLKASRSFFSLSTFRSRGSEGKSR